MKIAIDRPLEGNYIGYGFLRNRWHYLATIRSDQREDDNLGLEEPAYRLGNNWVLTLRIEVIL